MADLTTLTEYFFYSAYVELFLNGIYSMLMLLTIYIVIYDRTLKAPHYILIGVNFILYSMSIISVASWGRNIQDAFVKHGGSAESVSDFIIDLSASGNTIPAIVLLRGITSDIMTVIADFILAWRVYAVWGSRWSIALPSFVMATAGIGLMAAYIEVDSSPDSETLHFKRVEAVATAYYATTLANTLLSTILIIWRILRLGGMNGDPRYRRIVAALVESAALYAVILIIYLPYISNFGGDIDVFDVTLLLQSMVIPISGIAPNLMLLRILTNRCRDSSVHVSSGAFLDSLRFPGSHTQVASTAFHASKDQTELDEMKFREPSRERLPVQGTA